jgi:DNA polymerase-3 subunit delta
MKNEITIGQILDDLKKKIYYPVYFLYGEESWFIDEISDFIGEHVLDETEKEFNQMIIYGKDVDTRTLIGYARRFPMMANYLVIIVKEAQQIDKIEELAPYIENPLKSTLLVICYKYEKIDRRKSFYKLVEKTGILFESPRIYDNKIPDWITDYIGQRNYRITPKAAYLLAEFLGNDLSRIVNELGKLTINLRKGQEINEEYVERNIGISKDFNVFELQKALGSKDILKANRIIQHFASNPKENPLVKVIPILYSFFAKVLIYHSLQDKSRKNVASELSVNPFFIPDFQVAARNYATGKLISVVSVLREYDLKAKGVDNVSASDGELMKEMIYKILH